MSAPEIDPQRLASEIAEDAAVLAELAANGDNPLLVRLIDLHFKGAQDRIEALADDADALGFEFVEFGEFEDGDWAADFVVEGTTKPADMAALTKRALEIEITHGVEFDGWGCAAETGTEN